MTILTHTSDGAGGCTRCGARVPQPQNDKRQMESGDRVGIYQTSLGRHSYFAGDADTNPECELKPN